MSDDNNNGNEPDPPADPFDGFEVYVTEPEVAAAWPGFSKLPEGERIALIIDASAAVRDHCRRDLARAVRTEVHDGRARPRVWLTVRPVVEVRSVAVGGVEIDNADGQGWTVDAATGELLRGNGRADPWFALRFPAGKGNVVVEYEGGYDPIPPPIKRAAILTVRRFAEAARASGVYRSEAIGDYSYALAEDARSPISDFVADLLAPYVAGALG